MYSRWDPEIIGKYFNGVIVFRGHIVIICRLLFTHHVHSLPVGNYCSKPASLVTCKDRSVYCELWTEVEKNDLY